MICSLLKILKTAVLLTPFYNLYGNIYVENDHQIVGVKMVYSNTFGSNTFIVKYKDGLEDCIYETKNTKSDYEIKIKKYENRHGNTFVINNLDFDQYKVFPENIFDIQKSYRINQDKFKVSNYHLHKILNGSLENKKVYYNNHNNHNNKHNNKHNNNHIKHIKHIKYQKCIKSHLHLEGNKWPDAKKFKIDDKNIIKNCFKTCVYHKYNYFGIDSGNICWCAHENPVIRDVKNMCLSCSNYKDNSYTCGNVNYGFISVYKIYNVNRGSVTRISNDKIRLIYKPTPTRSVVNSTVVPTRSVVNSTIVPTRSVVNSTVVPTRSVVNSTVVPTRSVVNSTNKITNFEVPLFRLSNRNFTMLEKILSVIDKQLNVSDTKETITEIWNGEDYDYYEDEVENEED